MGFTIRYESPFVQLTVSVEFWSWGMTGLLALLCLTGILEFVPQTMRTEDVEDLDGLLVTKCPLSSSSCLGVEDGQTEQDLT